MGLDFAMIEQAALDDAKKAEEMSEALNETKQAAAAAKKEDAEQAVKESQQANRNREDANVPKAEKEDVKSEKETFRREVTYTDTKAQTRGRKATNTSDTVQIRDFPKSLIQMVKEAFPEASNTKALAAFCYANRDISKDIAYDDVPEDVIKLASTIEKYKMMQAVDENMRRLMAMVTDIKLTTEDIALGNAFIIHDRIFGGPQVQHPSEINFMRNGVAEISKKIEESNDEIRKMNARIDGRPIK